MEEPRQQVLLVDDEPNILNALRRELADWAEAESLEILTANSAVIGLHLLEKYGGTTVLIVSDLKMPEMKGSDFLMAVKQKYPQIVSILLTGFSETEEVIKAVRAGIFSYILKPWESTSLLAEIHKAFEHGRVLRQNAKYLRTVEEELKIAGEMQKAMLKPNLPKSEGVEFRVTYRPVPGLYCSGDYYDVIFLGTNRYLLLIGDVAGHGLKAALITGILKAVIYPEYIRNMIGKPFSPGAFLSWLNERMHFEFRATSDMLITFFAGVLDLDNATFKYANAGHCRPFLLRNGDSIELSVSGSGLGFVQSMLYSDQSIRVSPRDQLLFYTDGLVEIGCENGCKEPLKLNPLLKTVARGEDYQRRLLQAALEAAGAKDFTDDVTLLTGLVL